MKKYLVLLAAIISVVVVACNKTESDNSALLEGNWEMMAVQTKSDFSKIQNPGNLGDVLITFAAGKLSGKTPSNDIWPSDYTTSSGNQLSVPVIGATKVGENVWGSLFYKNMYSIESYSFQTKNTLLIGTKEKILWFKRL